MKKTMFLLVLIGLLLTGCPPVPQGVTVLDPPPFVVTQVSDDPTYGYSEDNPVQVGGGFKAGPPHERFYLDQLRGPNGERISYRRLGSCCSFPSESDPYGGGTVPLDMYKVTYRGSTGEIIIYINMYDLVDPRAPVGFTVGPPPGSTPAD